MGPTIQLGYMGHLRNCLIGRDAQCHTHYHPGPIVHYLGTEVVNASIIQSITRTILKFQSN